MEDMDLLTVHWRPILPPAAPKRSHRYAQLYAHTYQVLLSVVAAVQTFATQSSGGATFNKSIQLRRLAHLQLRSVRRVASHFCCTFRTDTRAQPHAFLLHFESFAVAVNFIIFRTREP